MDGNLGRKGPWTILRALINPEVTKTHTRLAKLTYVEHRKRGDIFGDLNRLTEQKAYQEVYEGQDDEELDSPITIAEVKNALHKLNTMSVPGQDGTSNKIICNSLDCELESLTALFNQVWDSGEVPGT